MLNWAQLIKERDEWVARNFPPYPGEVPGNDSVLGCIEELGELAHAHLKRKQGIRGTPEEHDAAAQDAIGDLTVYLLGVMSFHRVDPETKNHVMHGKEDTLLVLAATVGQLGLMVYEEWPRSAAWKITCDEIIEYMMDYCSNQGWDYEAIVTKTWDHVKQRDWVKHRAEGAAKDDPTVKDPSL